MDFSLLTLDLRREADLVLVRNRARQVSHLLGFAPQHQIRVATAASEVARNVLEHAQGGRAEFVVDAANRVLCLRFAGTGSGGSLDLAAVLEGRSGAADVPDPGITAARRLMDGFRIDSSGAETTVTLKKTLPPDAPTDAGALERVARELAQQHEPNPVVELEQQNRELLRTLDELRERQDMLKHLNRELEDTNRDVVALYAELEERARREQAAREIAEQAVHARDAVLSIVSHDLRNPIGTVITGVAFLQDILELAPAHMNHLAVVRRAAERANRLIDDLLDVSRIESGELSISPSSQEVPALLAEAVEMLFPAAHAHGLELRAEIYGDPAPVWADHGRVLQVLGNLGGNAAKFTPRGGKVLLSAEAVGEVVRFAVSDTGPGMAPEQLEQVFNRFWQAQRGDRRGAGLGLSIARGIVESHGGAIEVHSTVGEGATFFFTLPTAAAAAAT